MKMKNFGVLYGYELKKILRRKIVWVATSLMLVITLISSLAHIFGDYVVDGKRVDSNYHQFLIDREYERTLSGRPFDQAFLDEIEAGYDKIPENVASYTTTEEYQTYARPYSNAFHIVRWMAGMTVSEAMAWEMDYEEMYERHTADLEEGWKECLLTEAEKEYWRGQEAALPRPLIYEYDETYVQLLDMLYAVSIPMFLYVGICLSGVFAEENSRRTDQLILSSRYGKQPLYLAKIFAGLSFTTISVLIFSAVMIGTSIIVYGADGFSAAVQLTRPAYSGHLSVGMAALIGYAVLVVACVLTAGIVLLLSQLLRSSVTALALVTACIVCPMFVKIPEQYRAFGQFWDYLPFNFAAAWNILDVRLVPVFGKLFQSWQIVPICYLIVTAVFAVTGCIIYSRSQVKSR